MSEAENERLREALFNSQLANADSVSKQTFANLMAENERLRAESVCPTCGRTLYGQVFTVERNPE
jgi:hypothetical protein